MAVVKNDNEFRKGSRDLDPFAMVVPGHTLSMPGEVKVASGATDFLPGFNVYVPTGQTVRVFCGYGWIYSGTSATLKWQDNGSDITGFTSISVTTSPAATEPTPVTLAAGYHRICPVITAVSGTPTHLSFTIFLEYTK